jgi:prephenate dehydratase
MHIAIQGEIGSFHHQATLLWSGAVIDILPAATFSDVFQAIEHGQVNTAIVAIENSLYGSINEVLDLIEAYRFPIVGELYLRIRQQLVILPGATKNTIQTIYSHPVALAQCEQYLDRHFPNARRIEYHDTAGAVRLIKEKNDPSIAAIAGVTAAELYDLPILAHDIEDNKQNYTRFLVLKQGGVATKNANKASLSVVTSHSPGALAHVLSLFANAGANLTKLQSRPIIGDAWQYRFYIDVEVAGTPLRKLLSNIARTGATVTILGEYVSGTTY